MKFPLLANAFGRQKLILEIGGNAIGYSGERHQPQQHRRHRLLKEAAPTNLRPRSEGYRISSGV